jgi:SpoVK/Ycf46/Vps4 family AAA+-type ATPase
MTAVKSYLEDCKDDLTSDALAFGLVPAKGMLMVGLGGTGKSLGPKMSGTILKLPIIRWDMTKVFGKYVGESEAKMSGGLSFIDSIKPCIVWVDELDKMGFGGSGHETSQHVLGQLLTSMQEGGPGRFWIFTANDPHKIPSWLIRAGRVDITFGVVLPGALERKSAFIIHLIKRKQRFNFDLTPAIKASKGFTPAEIESAVNSAVRNCLRNGKDAMSADYLVNALARMKPQSESHKTEFDQLISWCNENAVPASTEEDRAELDDTPKKGGPPRAPAPLPPQKPIVKPVPTTFIKLRKPAPRI